MNPPKADLSDFEDADPDFEYTLPPRPRTPAPTDVPLLPNRRPVLPESAPAVAPAAPNMMPPRTADQDHTPVTVSASARRRGVGRPLAEQDHRHPDRPRGSTLMVDASLVPGIHEVAERDGLSRGELFIRAIEFAWDQLPDVLRPTPVGGSLFAARPTVKRTAGQAQVAMNYRLRGTEFDRLDELVDQVQAASRSHLINAALRIYLNSISTL